VVAAFAAPEGVEHLKKFIPVPYSLWLGTLDAQLNSQSYIVPGLGDAGDLAFGEKI
jgi:uracil phosphoribosyltransferase